MLSELDPDAVEAVAQTIARRDGFPSWLTLSGDARDWYLDSARDVIVAAAPKLQAGAVRDAAEEWKTIRWFGSFVEGTDRRATVTGMSERATKFLHDFADALENGGRS